MATTTPFIALGAGNGFPFCLQRFTMAQVGGDKGSPDISPSFFSLNEVMKYFWSAKSNKGTLSWNTFIKDREPNENEIVSVEIEFELDEDFQEPFRRVCLARPGEGDSTPFDFTNFNEEIFLGINLVPVFISDAVDSKKPYTFIYSINGDTASFPPIYNTWKTAGTKAGDSLFLHIGASIPVEMPVRYLDDVKDGSTILFSWGDGNLDLNPEFYSFS